MASSSAEVINHLFSEIGVLITDSVPFWYAFIGIAFGFLALSLIFWGLNRAVKNIKGRKF